MRRDWKSFWLTPRIGTMSRAARPWYGMGICPSGRYSPRLAPVTARVPKVRSRTEESAVFRSELPESRTWAGSASYASVSARTRRSAEKGPRRARICRKRRQLPREQQDRLLDEREILGFLGQSRTGMSRGAGKFCDARLADLATLVPDRSPDSSSPLPLTGAQASAWRTRQYHRVRAT